MPSILKRRIISSFDTNNLFLSAPNLYTCEPSSDSSIHLAWDSVPNAILYDIFISIDDGNNYSYFTSTASLVLEASPLIQNQRYDFIIRARAGSTVGPFSNSHYTWPVLSETISWGSIVLANDWENYELLYYNLLLNELADGLINVLDFDNFMVFSPTACMSGVTTRYLYDSAQQISQTGYGFLPSENGIEFSGVGGVVINIPSLDFGVARADVNLMILGISNVMAPMISGWKERVVFAGALSEEFYFELGQQKSESILNLYYLSVASTIEPPDIFAIDSTWEPSSAFLIGGGIDTDTGNILVFKSPLDIEDDFYSASGMFSGQTLTLGATMEGSEFIQNMEGNINFFCFGGNYTSEVQKNYIFQAIQNWNIRIGRL